MRDSLDSELKLRSKLRGYEETSYLHTNPPSPIPRTMHVAEPNTKELRVDILIIPRVLAWRKTIVTVHNGMGQ